MKRWVALGTAILFAVGMLSSCRKTMKVTDASNFTVSSAPAVTVQDYPVTVNGLTLAEVPEHVVVLSPSLAEIAADMGFSSRLCGRTEECNYPQAVSVLTSVGKTLLPEQDKIEAVTPDLVLAQSEPSATLKAWLTEKQIPLLIIPAALTYEEIQTMYVAVGQALGGKETGAAQAETILWPMLQSKMQSVSNTIATSVAAKKLTALYVSSVYGNVATGDTIIHSLLTTAGADNAAKAGTGWNLPDGAAATVEVIFCPTELVEQVKTMSVYKNTSAVKNARVYGLDTALTERQGLRIAEAVQSMAKLLYPTAFEASTSAETTGSATVS